jgi:hypothetical protein
MTELSKEEVVEWLRIPTSKKFLEHVKKRRSELVKHCSFQVGYSDSKNYAMNKAYLDGYIACVEEFQNFIDSARSEAKKPDEIKETSDFTKKWGM